MARAGTVEVDVEPGLGAVGGKIAAFAQTLKPLGLRTELLGDLGGDLQRESQQGERALRGLGDTGEREIGRISNQARLSGSQLALLGGGATVLGAKVLSGLRPAVEAASDLNETQAYSVQVFGDSAAAIEKWSSTASTSLLMSQREATDAANTFATFGKAAGLAGDDLVGFSTDLALLAADLASAKNTTGAEAITAIGAALRGETEPIRNYGVLLDDVTVRQEALALGIVKTTKDALTPQQKVLAVNSLLYKQTSDAQGDVARNLGTLASTEKEAAAEAENARAKLGEGLAPALASVTKVGTETLEVLGKVPWLIEGLGVAAAGFGGTAILGGGLTAILGARREIQALRSTTDTLGSTVGAVGPTATRSFGSMGTALQGVGAIMASLAIAEGVGAIANELRGIDGASNDAMESFVANIERNSGAVVAAFDTIAGAADARSSISDVIKSVGEEFSFAGETDVRDIEYFQEAFDSISATRPVEEVQKFIAAAREQNSQLDRNSNDYKETEKLLDEWAAATGTAADAQENAAPKVMKLGNEVDRFGNKVDEAKGKFGQAADVFAQAFEAPDDAVDAFNELIDARREEADAIADLDRLRSGSAESMEEEADRARDLADAVRSVEGAKRDLQAAERDAADASRDRAALEAELARVDPQRDPNRYRELAEKVRDARDDELDARDQVADATDSLATAEGNLLDKRNDAVTKADEVAAAEERVAQAQERSRDAAQNWEGALATLADELAENPGLIDALNIKIDEYVAKGWLAADAAAAWKAQLEGVARAAKDLPVPDDPTAPDPTAANSPTSERRGRSAPPVPTKHVIGTPDAVRKGLVQSENAARSLADGHSETDMEGRRWKYDKGTKSWTAWFHQGGLVDDEMANAQGDVNATLQVGEVVMQRSAVARLGASNLLAANNGAPLPAAPPSNTEVVAELQAVRSAIGSLAAVVGSMQNVTYAPTINGVTERDAEPLMTEAFRESRRDAWNNHARRLPSGR